VIDQARARDLEAARSYGLHALRHARLVDHAYGRGRAHAFLGSVLEALKRPEQAAAERGLAVEEMRRLGDRRATAELLLQMAEPPSAHDADTRSRLEEAGALAAEIGWPEGVTRSRAGLSRA
jgi:hypothetical protein